MNERWLILPYWAWALIGLALAVVFVFVNPMPKPALGGYERLFLRWGHPLAWALLACAALVRGSLGTGGLSAAKGLALLAGVSYFLFLATVIRRG